MTTEDRMSRLEGAYEQVNERLSDLHVDLMDVRERVSENARKIDQMASDIRGEIAAQRRENMAQFEELRSYMLKIALGMFGIVIAAVIAVMIAIFNAV